MEKQNSKDRLSHLRRLLGEQEESGRELTEDEREEYAEYLREYNELKEILKDQYRETH